MAKRSKYKEISENAVEKAQRYIDAVKAIGAYLDNTPEDKVNKNYLDALCCDVYDTDEALHRGMEKLVSYICTPYFLE